LAKLEEPISRLSRLEATLKTQVNKLKDDIFPKVAAIRANKEPKKEYLEFDVHDLIFIISLSDGHLIGEENKEQTKRKKRCVVLLTDL
jgi:hypothetical protein